MLKENQIEDLYLYLNMICDIINLVFNKMEETFQSNTLDWSSLVYTSNDASLWIEGPYTEAEHRILSFRFCFK